MAVTVTQANVQALLGGTTSGSDTNYFGFVVLAATHTYHINATQYKYEMMFASATKTTYANEINTIATYDCAIRVLNVIKGMCIANSVMSLDGLTVAVPEFIKWLDSECKSYREGIDRMIQLIQPMASMPEVTQPSYIEDTEWSG